jgi:hypothetical protein
MGKLRTGYFGSYNCDRNKERERDDRRGNSTSFGERFSADFGLVFSIFVVREDAG